MRRTRAGATLESVERILGELHFQEIPRILALNKIDLVDEDTTAAIMRQAGHDGAREVVAISAVDSKGLQPLLEKAGAIIARDLTAPFARIA